jgi:hypothetical protein
MSDIVIEKGVEIPKKVTSGRKSGKYPLKDMEVGDCFTVPNPENLSMQKLRNRINSMIVYFCKTSPTHFTTRTVEDKIKVWRTK